MTQLEKAIRELDIVMKSIKAHCSHFGCEACGVKPMPKNKRKKLNERYAILRRIIEEERLDTMYDAIRRAKWICTTVKTYGTYEQFCLTTAAPISKGRQNILNRNSKIYEGVKDALSFGIGIGVGFPDKDDNILLWEKDYLGAFKSQESISFDRDTGHIIYTSPNIDNIKKVAAALEVEVDYTPARKLLKKQLAAAKKQIKAIESVLV